MQSILKALYRAFSTNTHKINSTQTNLSELMQKNANFPYALNNSPSDVMGINAFVYFVSSAKFCTCGWIYQIFSADEKKRPCGQQ